MTIQFSDLVGKVLKRVEHKERGYRGSDEVQFETVDGQVFTQYHEQDCCEGVYVEDIVGELNDLIDTPILMAEESSHAGEDDGWGSSTWTFYRISTIKGSVIIRWYGSSNGYYSESVSFVECISQDDGSYRPKYYWDD